MITVAFQQRYLRSLNHRFLVTEVTKDVLGPPHVGDGLANGEEFCDLDYPNEFAYFLEPAEHAQHGLDKLAGTVAPFGICFAPLKLKMLPLEWTKAAPTLQYTQKN